jgi:chitin synthase
MILMRFLNRIHYNMPMTPMELEMHHQIRNIIGVQPTFYEYCLQIDADTVVAPDSATRMVSAFMQDTRLIGVCGETALTNAKASMVTMIQVYEYYISHNLTKAFESLFGSVTCLPGCFSMYRIRAQDSGKPLFVSKEVVDGYAENRVDTLHMKNLLHLGEDRYLTTLLLKHHRSYKTKYIFRAHAWTIAPDSWSIFLSQRRRWINSTVHNLVELMPLAQLCGFCCFSMRFVVFLDLLSTIVQPVLMGYIGYLIYLLVTSTSVIPMTAFILLGAIYGLQAVIFIARRKWEMVGWMIVYIFATPVFSFALPLYAFWHMDDFSWGNTRIVTGEKGQKLILSDEGVFDPNSIPRKRWEEYQAELWEMHSQYQADGMSAAGAGWRDDRSEASAAHYSKAASRAASRTGSMVDLPRANPRVSLAPTAYGALTGGEDPSAPSSTPGESPSVVAGGELPSEDMLLREIRNILAGADLMQVTTRNVRAELERRFGCNLRARKEYIKAATQAVTNEEL